MSGAADLRMRELFEALYRDFNARDVDALLPRMAEHVEWPNAWEGGHLRGRWAVADYWRRQWAEIDPTVTPASVATLPDGRVDVTVDQIIRDRQGNLLRRATVHHIYRLDEGLVAAMEIIEMDR